MSKLLGAPFGLSLSTSDVNLFLHKRLTSKLTHWSTTKVNRTGRSIIANSILLSSLFFFFSVWGGMKKGVAKLKSSILNYLAAGKMERSRARVDWLQCCQRKEEGGINLINPEDAVAVLMVKWVIKALEPGQSNLHLLLRHKLSEFQPYSGGRWQPSLEFCFIPKHQARTGSIVWNRVIPSWKSVLHGLQPVLPASLNDLLSMSWWWNPFLPQIGPGFSKLRAAKLHQMGLCRYRDVWHRGHLMTFAEAQGNTICDQKKPGHGWFAQRLPGNSGGVSFRPSEPPSRMNG